MVSEKTEEEQERGGRSEVKGRMYYARIRGRIWRYELIREREQTARGHAALREHTTSAPAVTMGRVIYSCGRLHCMTSTKEFITWSNPADR